MRADRHDDLVSTAAIFAGTTVSVVVTVVSFLLSGDDSAAAPDVDIGTPSSVEQPEPVLLRVDPTVVQRAIIIRPHDPTAPMPEDESPGRIHPAPGR